MAKPLMLRIESELDERSATAAISRAQRVYSDAAQGDGPAISLTSSAAAPVRAARRSRRWPTGRGIRTRGSALPPMILAEQERVLARMREDGARGVEVQAERVKAAP